jgi:hypothetical protein
VRFNWFKVSPRTTATARRRKLPGFSRSYRETQRQTGVRCSSIVGNQGNRGFTSICSVQLGKHAQRAQASTTCTVDGPVSCVHKKEYVQKQEFLKCFVKKMFSSTTRRNCRSAIHLLAKVGALKSASRVSTTFFERWMALTRKGSRMESPLTKDQLSARNQARGRSSVAGPFCDRSFNGHQIIHRSMTCSTHARPPRMCPASPERATRRHLFGDKVAVCKPHDQRNI